MYILDARCFVEIASFNSDYPISIYTHYKRNNLSKVIWM